MQEMTGKNMDPASAGSPKQVQAEQILTSPGTGAAIAASLQGVTLRYGKTVALDNITLDFPARCMVGMIGPDGVGKSSLLSLVSGVRAVQEGEVFALGGNMRSRAHRDAVCPRIAYMPQGLGKNLYPTLSVEENLQFFARLFGHGSAERRRRIDTLTDSTGLGPFLRRPAGKLSGGMKQKLGLCCSLIHDPDLLILDEPTTGVDPLARSQFWDLIKSIRAGRPEMSVIVATAYMDEAETFDYLISMYGGKVLGTGTPLSVRESTQSATLEEAFIKMLPASAREGYAPVELKPLEFTTGSEIAIEASGLTMRFGNFTAVDHVSFQIRKGEIFGFLGSNGCGKSTTMKMLTGLLPPTEGTVKLFGHEVDAGDMNTRKRIGYMTQAFSLYGELTVRQNLVLHARLFGIVDAEIPERVQTVSKRFDLDEVADALPDNLPLGVRQRMSLAVAVIHKPDMLILDEPTSGVDPVARDNFWRLLIDLSRNDHVTIFITTHFMNEAERCDRISLMHAGKVLACDAPDALVKARGAATLEEAFIGYLLDAGAGTQPSAAGLGAKSSQQEAQAGLQEADQATKLELKRRFSPRRFYSCVWRESLELTRDPIRMTLALLGSLILMLVMGYGITMDVENLSYAVLDRDDSGLSRNYALNISGSRYFLQRAPLFSYQDMDKRMREGAISMAVELPPNFGRDMERGDPVSVGVWIDGAMPLRAETIRGYVQAMHQQWVQQIAVERGGKTLAATAGVEIRYRYNPDVKSLPAMVPAVIPINLLMLPAMLAALAVVREKEMGSIINLYATPVTKAEFLLGKQVPYVLVSLASFLLMVLLAVTLFDVPVKGSFPTLLLGAALYCVISTGMGLLASTVTRSQIAVMLITVIGTMLPAIQFSGLLNATSSLEGTGRFIGDIFPTTYMLLISRGVFNKALGLSDLSSDICVLAVTIPVVLVLSISLLKKQDS